MSSLSMTLLFVLALAVLVAFVIWIGSLLAANLLGRVFRRIIANGPRPQPSVFALYLRDLVFSNPFAYMKMLWGDDRQHFLFGLWEKDVSWRVARARMPARLPSDGLAAFRLHLADGRAIAVIRTPKPKHSGEPYLIGIVLPADPCFAEDLTRAQKEVRYFILQPWSLGRNTDLCEWTVEGKLLTYNIGAPRDPEGFAAAVGAKLKELGR